jgi:Ser/Thr protein kinase RdoA (MazF antagonist)
LEDEGVSNVPRFVRRSKSEEILTFIPGTTIKRPWPKAALRIELMREMGALLKTIHLAVSGFTLKRGEIFAWGPAGPKPGFVVCHGDLGPWNAVLRNNRLAGLIDWDLARFGPPIEDVVEAAVELCPLRRNVGMAPKSLLTDSLRAKRLEALCEGFGDFTARDILRLAPTILLKRAADMRSFVGTGNELFEPLLKRGIPRELEEDADWIRGRRW